MGRSKTKDITNATTARLVTKKSTIGPRVVEDPYEFTRGYNQSGKTGEDPEATQASKEKSGGNGRSGEKWQDWPLFIYVPSCAQTTQFRAGRDHKVSAATSRHQGCKTSVPPCNGLKGLR